MRKALYSNIIALATTVCILFCTHASTAQNISVTSASGQNVATFIANELVGGGVYVYNIKFNGQTGNISKPQIGKFNANGYTQLYMDSGVVMTTGNVSVAPGPNNGGGSSSSVTGFQSDQELSSIASGSLNACAWLDFDFVSVSPFITVNYCFGSEEYPEYVCSSFNDVFAFYITGPDPNTGQSRRWNMASIPHTTSTSYPDGIPVTINAVNPGQAGSSGGSGSNCFYNFSQYYVSNTWNTGVEYDGFTRKLSASAQVVPCEVYHMHISICNVGDNAFDSGVFLEKKSFNSPMAQVNLGSEERDTVVHNQPKVVPLSIFGTDYDYGRTTLSFQGEAVYGVDYFCLDANGNTIAQYNNSLDITDSASHITIVGAEGAVVEHPKTINICLNTSLCQSHPDLGSKDTLKFVLVEDDIVALRDTTITCNDTCREVGVEIAVARRPLQFRWIPEDGIDFPRQQYSTALITESREYRVAAWDEVGNTDTATVSVVIEHLDIEHPAEGATPAVKVYPNPTDGLLHIEAERMEQVELYNTDGICVFSSSRIGNNTDIDTTPFAAGVYTLKVKTAHGTTTEKIIVK